MADNDHTPLKTYRGNCHCGAFVFEAQMPEIKDVMQCNCSICHRKGYLLVNPVEGSFRVVKGDLNQLTTYRFASEKIQHKFCPTCGIAVLATMPEGPPGMNTMLNAHSFQGVNTWDLEKKPYDGRALGNAYETPKHHGAHPKAEVEGGKTYTGSCHCGAVTVAVASKPIDETFAGRVMECNCSFCERGAYTWIYPLAEEVALASKQEEDIGRYSFGRNMLSKTFCTKCGTLLTNEYKPISDDEFAKLPEQEQKMKGLFEKHHPVNLRVFDGLDFSKLSITRNANGKNLWPPYENP
ncbi:unnamed protein product [Clonostachys rosea f. rosea IK726]|uniref:CENP-V/GFA domain-containing protein n=2 Tax=Bionectria ochroleuca TaxID=29856 RepID=A0A0B7JVT0_BIOOC|nr:unnamed protein product [Clonostachys rosea f. rosea IK726]